MLNLIELEKKWLRYKIKSFIPHIIIGISLLIIFVLLIIFFDTSKSKEIQPIKKNAKIETKPKIRIIKDKPLNIKKTPIIDIEKQTKISPSLNFIYELETQNQNFKEKENNKIIKYYKEPSTPKNTIKTVTVNEVKQTSKPVQETKIEQKVKEKNTDIVIQKQNTQNDIYEIIKRFKKSHNPALSLFVAKKYYDLGYYHQSYNYALVTNELNSEIEESWIIFSKSLVKLGEKDKAMKILKRYIINSHSSNAQILLNDIQAGKFK